jgi:hypothetical protein
MTTKEKQRLRTLIEKGDDVTRVGATLQAYNFLKKVLKKETHFVVVMNNQLYLILSHAEYSGGPYYTPPHFSITKIEAEKI